MECYLSFSVKAEEMTVCCLGIASCLSSQTHLKKKTLLSSLPSYGTEVKFVNLFQTIQVRELLTCSHTPWWQQLQNCCHPEGAMTVPTTWSTEPRQHLGHNIQKNPIDSSTCVNKAVKQTCWVHWRKHPTESTLENCCHLVPHFVFLYSIPL